MSKMMIDTGGVGGARALIEPDPATLTQCAVEAARACAAARSGVGPDAWRLAQALSNVGLVVGASLDAVSDASSVLGRELDLAAWFSGEAELTIGRAIGTLQGASAAARG